MFNFTRGGDEVAIKNKVFLGSATLQRKASQANATINVRMQFVDDTGKKDQTFRWLLQFEKTGGNWVVAKRESL